MTGALARLVVAARFLGRFGYAARRLGWAVVMVVGVASVCFVVARVLPGDPVRMLVGPQAPQADTERAREIYGLHRPLWVQYGRFWRHLVHRPAAGDEADAHAGCAAVVGSWHVDLGFSWRYGKPVVTLIADKAPVSIRLALAALAMQALLGLGVGVMAARRRGSLADRAAVGAMVAAVSAPTFALGLLLQYLLAYKLHWLPIDGYGKTAAEQLESMVLPALTLGIFGAALYARLTREEVAQALAQDYARAARARGASEWRVLVVHALRNAVLPIATLMALDLGALVGGAVVTEKLFRWPGMGAMTVDALVNRDGPVILGTVLFSSFAIVIASLGVDLLAWLLDPRLRRPS
jgi:peptide/nickel transport system permease protein